MNINTNVIQQQNSSTFVAAIEENKILRRQIDEILNGSNEFGNSSNVVMMQHYAQSQQEMAIIKEQ
jgi:hypothetical protein